MIFSWLTRCLNAGFLLLFFQTPALPELAKINLTLLEHTAIAQTNKSSELICRGQLKTAIDQVINRPQFRRARWGILIESLSPTVAIPLYRHNAERFFIPASNVKLLTTAAALHQLGASYRIKTSVYQLAENVLRVVGRGDPSLQDAQLKDLAQQLKRQGIRNVKQLIVDDGYFQGDSINLTWDWQDVQSDYGTTASSLILNQNAAELSLSPQQIGQKVRISWTDTIASRQWQVENTALTAATGTPNSLRVTAVLGQPLLQIKGQLAVDAEPEIIGLPILNPSQYFLESFQQALLAQGISVTQAVVSSQDMTEGREVAQVESPPLATLLVETNQASNNLYAEVLLRTLGVSSSNNTAELGIKKINEILTVLGVSPDSYNLIDGSGLSRQNLLSPEAIVQTLKGMAQTPEAFIYRTTLSSAGVSGTLRQRFLNTPVQGNLQAKTGTLMGVSALSGYLNVPNFQPLVFSLLINQSNQSAITDRQALDEIVLLLMQLRSC